MCCFILCPSRVIPHLFTNVTTGAGIEVVRQRDDYRLLKCHLVLWVKWKSRAGSDDLAGPLSNFFSFFSHYDTASCCVDTMHVLDKPFLPWYCEGVMGFGTPRSETKTRTTERRK